MKIILLLSALLFTNISFAQTSVVSKANGLEFIELDHGIANTVRGTLDKLENTPAGTHSWLKELEIIKVTDSIKLTPKNKFAVVYVVKSKDTVEINVDIEWIYPETITNDKGEKFKSIRYTTKRPTNIPSGSSYTLDEPYEMVKGPWIVNIYILNVKMYARTFMLY